VHTQNEISEVKDTTVASALTVDTTPPATPTVNSLDTNSSKPVITGSWDQGTPGGATVLQVTVNGTTFTLGSNSQLPTEGAGDRTLPTPAAIPDATFIRSVHTENAASKPSDGTAAGALTVDTAPPAAPTANSIVTNSSTPILTGTWGEGVPGGATVLQVTV